MNINTVQDLCTVISLAELSQYGYNFSHNDNSYLLISRNRLLSIHLDGEVILSIDFILKNLWCNYQSINVINQLSDNISLLHLFTQYLQDNIE